MLSTRTVLVRDGICIADVACRHAAGRGSPEQQTGGRMVVFVRRGRFLRSVEGEESVLEPTVAYCMNPGEEQRCDHPDGHGDDCTSLELAEDLAASILGGNPTLPAGPIHTSSPVDLEHRLLLAAARRGEDPGELVERAIALAARALEQAEPARVAAGRPATARARRALVDGAREALIARPERPLPELARELAVSPHHLSRIFRRETGHTIARHRMRVRTRAALERLDGGEQDLAGLAFELGFADQSHLCRVLREETGSTPAALRAALA